MILYCTFMSLFVCCVLCIRSYRWTCFILYNNQHLLFCVFVFRVILANVAIAYFLFCYCHFRSILNSSYFSFFCFFFFNPIESGSQTSSSSLPFINCNVNFVFFVFKSHDQSTTAPKWKWWRCFLNKKRQKKKQFFFVCAERVDYGIQIEQRILFWSIQWPS